MVHFTIEAHQSIGVNGIASARARALRCRYYENEFDTLVLDMAVVACDDLARMRNHSIRWTHTKAASGCLAIRQCKIMRRQHA